MNQGGIGQLMQGQGQSLGGRPGMGGSPFQPGQMAQNFLRTVIENGRLAALPEIAVQFRALKNAQGGSSDAVVYSAFPIADGPLADVMASLEKRFARKLKAGTVRVNGGQGTDHGTGGLAILAGGAIKGGRMLGDWPGLKSAALFENRDLMPAVDMRAVFKGLMRDHLGWATSDLDTSIFHDSAAARPFNGMI